MDLVSLNVGGTVFQTQNTTLKAVPKTRLSNDKLLAETFIKDKQHYFFDRDPQVFSYILNFYRTGELHLPSGVCSSTIRNELKFWMVPEERVAECCWKTLNQLNGETRVLRQLNDLFQDEITDCITSVNIASRFKRMRHNLWMFLEYPSSSWAAKIWESFYFTLIVISAFVFLLDSVDMLREPDTDLGQKCAITKEENVTTRLRSVVAGEFFKGSKAQMKYLLTRPLKNLEMLDAFLTIVFTLELLARFVLCPRKCQFMKTILNILDLLFLVCKYPLVYMERFSCFINVDLMYSYTILKALTAVRLIRLFRIGRTCQGFKVMLLAIKASSSELVLMIGSFLCVTVLFAAAAYMAELPEDTFSNMLYACWWAMITMTTVGYGDLFPITPAGRVIGAICAVAGLVVLTLPIAVIGTNFAEYNNINRNRDMRVKQRKVEISSQKAIKGIKGMNKIQQTKVTDFKKLDQNAVIKCEFY